MKPSKLILTGILCLLLAGCSNEFAQQEYDSAEKIAQSSDRYSKQSSVFRTIDGGCTLTVAKFDGRETLWSDRVKADQEIELEVSLTLSEGQAKLVHVAEDGTVTTILACTPETAADKAVTKSVAMKKGRNKLKLVGYDCKDIALTLLVAKEKEA